ncbi:hypothetical protein DSECCO2_500670 [anaerobic digester metagenome]
MKMFGTKTRTDPTPPMIPSPTSDASHAGPIDPATAAESRASPASIRATKGAATANVSSNVPHIRARKIGMPRYRSVTTRSTISETFMPRAPAVRTCGRTAAITS